jgi:hypothetical protein
MAEKSDKSTWLWLGAAAVVAWWLWKKNQPVAPAVAKLGVTTTPSGQPIEVDIGPITMV